MTSFYTLNGTCFTIISVSFYDYCITGIVASGRGKIIIILGLFTKTANYLHGNCEPLAGLDLSAGNPCSRLSAQPKN